MAEASYRTGVRAAYDTVAADYAEHSEGELEAEPLGRAMLSAFAEIVHERRRSDAATGKGDGGDGGDGEGGDPGGVEGARAGGGGEGGDRVRSGRPVADLGCGPGRVTAHLSALGLPVFGIDLSSAMVALARRAYPELRFDQGTMTELDLDDGVLAGIVAWYSIIHIPPGRLAALFTEFHRVLTPGGLLLLAFQVGDGALHLTEAFGRTLSLEVHRLRPDRVTALLDDAGFAVGARMVREPGASERVPQAYLLARRR